MRLSCGCLCQVLKSREQPNKPEFCVGFVLTLGFSFFHMTTIEHKYSHLHKVMDIEK